MRKMLQVGYTVVSDAAEAIRVKANDWTLKSKARKSPRQDLQGQGLGSEAVCKCFGWTEGKNMTMLKKVDTVPCVLAALVETASHY